MNSRAPLRKNSESDYSKTAKDYVITRQGTQNSEIGDSVTNRTGLTKRSSIDQSSMRGSSIGKRRNSRTSSEFSELPEPKSIDNFLSNTQKNLKAKMQESSNLPQETIDFSQTLSDRTNSEIQDQTVGKLDALDISGIQAVSSAPAQSFSRKCITQTFGQQLCDENSKIFSVRYDPQDEFIGFASEDGVVRIVSSQKGTVSYNLQDFDEKGHAATCLRWRPELNNQNLKHSLICSYAGGKVIFWHVTSQKMLARYQEEENDITACEFTIDGNQFITAGSDAKIRLYDIGKKACTLLSAGTIPEHKNRVFAAKFADQNTLLTAGWDKNVLIWDMRTHQTSGYIYGPMICGDSLDVKGNSVLTGSWRSENQLQLWDLRKTNKSTNIAWDNFSNDPREQSFIYSCQFSKNNENYIMAGSTGTYEMRLFDRKNNNRCIDSFSQNITKGVLSLDWSNSKQKLTYSTSNGYWGSVEVN